MTHQRPRTGLYALLDGREYAAGQPENGQVALHSAVDPQDTRFKAGSSGWRAVVPVDACERLDEVTTRANHLGHECLVVGITPEGSVGLYYVGPDKTRATADGFVQIDPGTWAKNVPIHEITRFREHHVDLLFPEWAKTH
ncbi:hypothetical protein V5P93_007325 [Actinokineospora auranticolor]|uniref:Uncharacterized protein n=1 Tax=Actinokineospora auranticolor TaxID=155976 RepID=A0A2S6GS04_9PSEU|nr:hypothetical protein [Actinokineospora auranticolor]PPK67979.1 hypothetical protein CLV40_106211 [Actinokineospora auranticolor]